MEKKKAIAAAVMIPAAFFVGAWAQSQRTAAAPPAVVDRTIRIVDHTDREDAVLSMLRLGAEDWMLACAWQTGHDGQPRDAMYRACSVKLDIGEKDHPERRRPAT